MSALKPDFFHVQAARLSPNILIFPVFRLNTAMSIYMEAAMITTKTNIMKIRIPIPTQIQAHLRTVRIARTPIPTVIIPTVLITPAATTVTAITPAEMTPPGIIQVIIQEMTPEILPAETMAETLPAETMAETLPAKIL